MLVLTRKKTEVIQIGENIVVKIIATGKSSVKIGIEAPENVRVLRGELEPHTGSQYLLERLKKRQSLVGVSGEMVAAGGMLTGGEMDEEVQPAVAEEQLVTADFS